ncbi:hypothetical protein N9C68_06575 [Gammaproteobacteria bacterium]|jgi:hypothetical protein|nr:hypothetical protein [Gammaproteobacteria bacterium]MDB2370808.1 hypothetical protein [Gammaproteobacteria bacterium]MDB2611668.1 hypothetical protein [Gammaproteobacteria bacterium]
MKKIVLALTLIALPSIASAELDIQEGYSIQGKIFAVKTAKKYSSVEGCSKIALSKTKVTGFTFESKSQKCTLYKKVRSLKANPGFVSGTK